MPNYQNTLDHDNANNQRVFQHCPETAGAFRQMYKSAIQPGALPSKQKELIALGIAIALRCEGCIVNHVQSAVRSGATMPEIAEVVGTAFAMGGGPALIYGGKALECAEEFLAAT